MIYLCSILTRTQKNPPPPETTVSKAPTPKPPHLTSSLKSLAPPPQNPFPSLGQIVTGLISFIYQTIQSLFSQIKEIFTELKKEEPIAPHPDSISEALTLQGREANSSLTISPKDRHTIYLLIKELATNDLAILLFHGARLTKIGAQLKHVHPYLFLATLFPESSEHMQKIYQEKDFLFRGRIWTDFVKDLAETFSHSKNLEGCRISFAEHLNLNPVLIKKYEDEKKWKELITYIVAAKVNH